MEAELPFGNKDGLDQGEGTSTWTGESQGSG